MGDEFILPSISFNFDWDIVKDWFTFANNRGYSDEDFKIHKNRMTGSVSLTKEKA